MAALPTASWRRGSKSAHEDTRSIPAVKKVAENSRYPTTARVGVEAAPRRRRAAAITTVSTKASRSRSPLLRIPPGDENAHDAEAAAKADQRTDSHRIESGAG